MFPKNDMNIYCIVKTFAEVLVDIVSQLYEIECKNKAFCEICNSCGVWDMLEWKY